MIKLFFIFLLFFPLQIFSQAINLKVNINSSFFIGQEDSLTNTIISRVIERIKSSEKKHNTKYNSIQLNNGSNYIIELDVLDTIVQYKEILHSKIRFIENDSIGWIFSYSGKDADKSRFITKVVDEITTIVKTFGDTSHTINTETKNIYNEKLSIQEKDSLSLELLRNIVVIFQIDKKIDKKNADIFKAIITNKYNNNQLGIWRHSLHVKKKRYCNIYIYDDTMPKNKIGNPIILIYKLSSKDNKYILSSSASGRYKKTGMGEPTKYLIIDKKDYERYPIKRIGNICSASYTIMKDALELW